MPRKKRYCQEHHSDSSCNYDFSRHWMERPGVVAATTTSVPSMKCSLIVPCLRRRAPHHCRDLDPSRTIGQASVDFSNHLALNDSGKWVSMVLSQYLGKLSAWDQMTKPAIMRRGYIYTSLIGIKSGLGRHTTTETFASRNDLRVLHIVLTSEISVRFWATTRSRHERATTCASLVLLSSMALQPLAHPWFLRVPWLIITKWPDEFWWVG